MHERTIVLQATVAERFLFFNFIIEVRESIEPFTRATVRAEAGQVTLKVVAKVLAMLVTLESLVSLVLIACILFIRQVVRI